MAASEEIFLVLSFHPVRDNGSNQDANGQGEQDRKGVGGRLPSAAPKERLRADS